MADDEPNNENNENMSEEAAAHNKNMAEEAAHNKDTTEEAAHNEDGNESVDNKDMTKKRPTMKTEMNP
jgi:hypothetical protein